MTKKISLTRKLLLAGGILFLSAACQPKDQSAQQQSMPRSSQSMQGGGYSTPSCSQECPKKECPCPAECPKKECANPCPCPEKPKKECPCPANCEKCPSKCSCGPDCCSNKGNQQASVIGTPSPAAAPAQTPALQATSGSSALSESASSAQAAS